MKEHSVGFNFTLKGQFLIWSLFRHKEKTVTSVKKLVIKALNLLKAGQIMTSLPASSPLPESKWLSITQLHSKNV